MINTIINVEVVQNIALIKQNLWLFLFNNLNF